VQQRRSLHIYRRCCLAVFIASTSTLAGSATISAAEPEVPPMLRIPAERTGTYVHENPPLNSTLKIRIARRPWLLEKLKTPSPKPSIKMTPPRPPAAIPDPPSMSLVVPENGSGWVTRGRVKTQVPHYADLKVEPEQTSSQAVASEDLNANQQIPQTKLQSVSQGTSTEPADSSSTKGSAEAGVIDTPAPTMSTRTSDDDVSDNTATEDTKSQVRPDVSEKSTQPNVAKKSKLKFKGTDPATSQTQIGEKSTATLKGSAVIVGDDDASSEDKTGGGQRTSNVDLTEKGGSPEPSTISAETSEQTTKDSPTDGDMAASPSQASPDADSSVTEDKQATEPKPKATDEVKAEESDKSGTVEEQNEATEPDSDEVSKKDDVVKVRKLRLQADGTVSDKTGLAESETASLKAEEEAKKEPTSQFVSSENPSATKIDYTGRPAEPIELTRSVSRMRNTIRQGLLYHYARPEAANERSNWGMLHSIMVFGADTKIRVNNRKYSAIAWIAGNNACRGQRLLTTKNDAITARSGVGLQGHQAQLLAVFSLCNVPLDYPIYASEEKFSIRDIVESEMLACRSGEELTFSLIGLSHYLDTDTIWLNADGETWSFERLIKEELSQPIVGAACGGTHRLMGFAHALRKRRAAGKPITGQWKRAEIFMKDFEKYAYRLQNRDGSMSTDWFEGREDNGDMDRKIQTTGHMVEWLLTITPDAKLQEPRLVNAVRFLANTIYTERGHDWKIGPKGHALRSLAMYYERVYGGDKAWQSSSMAKSGNQSRR
jgi:hypothetical protein